jgi:arylsulfate sulfotransferase
MNMIIKIVGNFMTDLSELLRAILIFVALFGLFVASGCNQGNESNTGPSFTMAPNPDTPLVGILNWTTDVPTRISLDVSDGSDGWEINFDEFSVAHSLPILGFRPGKKHTIRVRAIDEDDNESAASFEVTTDPLPEDFPEINVVSNPDEMEPGVTLFPAGDFLIAVNETGEVVWYHRVGLPGGVDRDLRRLKNGNLLLLLPMSRIIEIDMLGNLVQMWHASLRNEGDIGSIPVAAEAFHHDVLEMENGNFLVLSHHLRLVDNFPTSDTDPDAPRETATVADDVVVEFARDGTIVNQWSMMDLLDPLRIGYGSTEDQVGFVRYYPEVQETIRDWGHANAVVHDPRDDSIIVSLRQQDAVVKFSRKTGELIWILGPHENWNRDEFGDFLLAPTMDMKYFWQYHQHAPMLNLESDTILMYDNGNFRASPFDIPIPGQENFSRAVEYSINEGMREISQVWEYGQFADEIIFTPFIGDADSLPETGNVLITFGGILGGRQARIIEVTHTTPAEKVFDLSVNDFVYRSERLPSFYP